MPRELFKGFKMATQSKTTQPQPQAQEQLQQTESTEQLVMLSNEGDAITSSVQEPGSSSTRPPSARIGTSHFNISQFSLDGTSPTLPGSFWQRPLKPQRPSSQSSKERTLQASSPSHSRLDAAAGTGRGVGRIVSTGIRSPMNFSL